jgi:hypothetical protein
MQGIISLTKASFHAGALNIFSASSGINTGRRLSSLSSFVNS